MTFESPVAWNACIRWILLTTVWYSSNSRNSFPPTGVCQSKKTQALVEQTSPNLWTVCLSRTRSHFGSWRSYKYGSNCKDEIYNSWLAPELQLRTDVAFFRNTFECFLFVGSGHDVVPKEVTVTFLALSLELLTPYFALFQNLKVRGHMFVFRGVTSTDRTARTRSSILALFQGFS